MSNWKAYINYLENWAKEHSDEVFERCSPVCYDEFCDNELQENKQ